MLVVAAMLTAGALRADLADTVRAEIASPCGKGPAQELARGIRAALDTQKDWTARTARAVPDQAFTG